ncbi:MAG: hypothetical protein JO147_00555, partial [Actinobacteria bacterium]|nr:hypothetical protein [Actinomycetota bacterium]
LYVTEKDPNTPVPVRRRRRTPVAPAQATWQDVLYRGQAATATGAYQSDGAGPFKILAIAPEAPPVHNRRASDRMQSFNRRSTDRLPGEGGPDDRRPIDRRPASSDRLAVVPGHERLDASRD